MQNVRSLWFTQLANNTALNRVLIYVCFLNIILSLNPVYNMHFIFLLIAVPSKLIFKRVFGNWQAAYTAFYLILFYKFIGYQTGHDTMKTHEKNNSENKQHGENEDVQNEEKNTCKITLVGNVNNNSELKQENGNVSEIPENIVSPPPPLISEQCELRDVLCIPEQNERNENATQYPSQTITSDSSNGGNTCSKCGKHLNDGDSANMQLVSLLTDMTAVTCKDCRRIPFSAVLSKKPFPCNVCGKGFGRKSHLTRHSFLHTKEKLFSCTDCNKQFSRKDHLEKHAHTHSFKMTLHYECDLCGKRYNNKPNLNVHMAVHKANISFPCKLCDKTFTIKGELNRHITSEQGIFIGK